MSRHPSVKWAQSSDKVFITVELPDAKDVKLKLEPNGKFAFSATKDGTPYEFDFELFDKIKVEESKHNIGVRSIVYAVQKEEKKWWSRLLKQEGKPPVFLKVDWDKWKLDMGGDEDIDDDDDVDEIKDEEGEGEEEASEEAKADDDQAAEPVAKEAKA
ncbi:hypothetical protein V2J09_013533 [Rumex salicifolius]